ncbi:MAG: hypothetical protein JEY94_01940 [Melioribacteraceae bacterium]|nr:hypothetical protein [Melioribacteraceae bacterium]
MKKAINVTVIFTVIFLAAFSGVNKAERKFDNTKSSVQVSKSFHPIPPIKTKKSLDSFRPIPPIKTNVLMSFHPIPPIRTNMLSNFIYNVTAYLLK